MQSNFLAKLLTIVLFVFSMNVQAQHEEHEGTPEEVGSSGTFDISEC